MPAPAAITVADARPEDVGGIQAIYADAVATSAATFHLVAPDAAAWAARRAAADDAAGRFLLAALGDDGTVVGFAATGEFRAREAYRTTAEVSVYVAPEARRRGVGDALYAALIPRCRESSLLRLVAGVTQPNAASMALHAAHGFTVVGTFTDVGVKFGRPWDVTWLELAV